MPMDLPSAPETDPRWRWGVAAAAALVLVSIVFVYLSRRSAPPENAKIPAESAELVLQQMALVQEPPAFIPSPAGSGKADAEGKFQQGMREYSAGRYSEAIPRLEEVLQTDPENMAVTFYLGVSFLMADQPDKAIVQLSKLAASNSSYAHESRWYSAKAYLKKKDLAAARRELEAVIASDGMYGPEARKALERIDSLR